MEPMLHILQFRDCSGLNVTLIGYSEEGTPLISLNAPAAIADPVPDNNTPIEKTIIRVEWSEIRLGESYRVIADKQPGEYWEFWEKSMYEVKWYPMTSTHDLVDRADSLAAERQGSVQIKAARAA